MPYLESVRPEHSISRGCQMVPVEMEVTVDEGVDGEEPRCLFE
jgi:hypothetical protein